MCIILDANMLSRFKKRDDENMGPVRDWVYRGNGKIAYSTTEDLKERMGRKEEATICAGHSCKGARNSS